MTPDRDLGRDRPETALIFLVAALMAVPALATDAMLPALPQIASDLDVPPGNDQQLVVSVFFLGLGLGQLFFGPWSDAVGRKPALILGLAVFFAGSVMSAMAQSFEIMLLGRVIQGIGVASPRVLVLAMVRDRFSGDAMARIMSFVMVIFIIIPSIAPAIGQGVLYLAGWQAIFWLFNAVALICIFWVAFGQEETHDVADRIPFTFACLWENVVKIARTRTALFYALALSFVFAAFVAYLSVAQQVFQGIYDLGALFPLYFGILAASVGVSSLVNARLVSLCGAQRLAFISLVVFVLASLILLALSLMSDGRPPLRLLMVGLICCFFSVGLLIGNLNALAMEPMGNAAGTASAIIGAMTTIMSMIIGATIAYLYDETVIPMFAGFAAMGLCALVCVARVRYASDQSVVPEGPAHSG